MSTRRSSFYNSYLGETKTKFAFSNYKAPETIKEPEFFKWTSGNMYRTSYNDMANRVSYKTWSLFKIGQSVDRKNCIIPKYQGYVPNLRANSLLQKRITEQSRDVLTKPHMDDPVQTMSSTG